MRNSLSIVIPAYNEERTLEAIVSRIEALGMGDIRREIIVVDDGSTDDTRKVIERLGTRVQSVLLPENRGKGAALREGFLRATGNYVVVQDADLEYDPNDILTMLHFAHAQDARAVFGSRRLPLPGKQYTKRGAWYFYAGGVLLTWFTNILYGSAITDEPTCYKMVRRDVLNDLDLQAEGFEFCPEITAKLLRRDIRIHEVPIRYAPRSVAEGKKIRLRDWFIAVWTLLKYRI